MRILIVTGAFPPMKCGVGDYVLCLARELAAQGDVRVAVLTSTAAGDAPGEGVEVLPLVEGWGWPSLGKILRAIRDWGPDLVHVQYPTAGYGRCMGIQFLPLLLRLSKVPVVQTWHDPLSWKGRIRYLPNALTRDALVVVEPEYERLLPFWYRPLLGRKRMSHVPVGSNIPPVKLTDQDRREIRSRFDAGASRLIVYFGFVSPAKGVAQIFDLCDPVTDRIVLVCDLDSDDPCHGAILQRIDTPRWRGKVFVTGFLESEEVAGILAAADAAVFPFLKGAAARNASVLAARVQGTPVVTTSASLSGAVHESNVYYASPSDLAGMRAALDACAGKRFTSVVDAVWKWEAIAAKHRDVYEDVLSI